MPPRTLPDRNKRKTIIGFESQLFQRPAKARRITPDDIEIKREERAADIVIKDIREQLAEDKASK